jgi:glucokinase-like ROK family protein
LGLLSRGILKRLTSKTFIKGYNIHMKKNDRLRTGDSTLVRQINLSVIMNHLRKKAPISRAGLAQATGLNKTTVSSLVDELLQRQFVREIGFTSAHKGHPAIMLNLNPAAGFIVGCEIGVDFILVVCTNFTPEIIWRHEERTDPNTGQHAILDRATALLNEAIQRGYQKYGTLLGIGVGVAALIDQSTGTMLFAPNLGWKESFPIRAMLQASFPKAPVIVDNEANIAALGEHYFGVAQGYDEVLYISAGVGLGGGIVHDGRVFSGVAGVGAEFGHMTMDPDGELCSCGSYGCWETQVSQRALFRHIHKSFELGETGMLFQLTNDGTNPLTVPMIVDAAHAGDAVALSALEKIGRDLGIGVASLVNALNPELVVCGGILSLAGEFLMPAMIKEFERRALRWNREATKVVLAKHGFDAAAMGGVAAVYETILAQPNLMGSLEL